MQVAMLQYPAGELEFAYGEIDSVNAKDITYRFGTAPGSSGSPVLSQDAEALALHRSSEYGDTGLGTIPLTQQPDLSRTATLLRVVIDAYLKERPNMNKFEYGLRICTNSNRICTNSVEYYENKFWSVITYNFLVA